MRSKTEYSLSLVLKYLVVFNNISLRSPFEPIVICLAAFHDGKPTTRSLRVEESLPVFPGKHYIWESWPF